MMCRRSEAAEPSPDLRGRAGLPRVVARHSNIAGTQDRRAVATHAVLTPTPRPLAALLAYLEAIQVE